MMFSSFQRINVSPATAARSGWKGSGSSGAATISRRAGSYPPTRPSAEADGEPARYLPPRREDDVVEGVEDGFGVGVHEVQVQCPAGGEVEATDEERAGCQVVQRFFVVDGTERAARSAAAVAEPAGDRGSAGGDERAAVGGHAERVRGAVSVLERRLEPAARGEVEGGDGAVGLAAEQRADRLGHRHYRAVAAGRIRPPGTGAVEVPGGRAGQAKAVERCSVRGECDGPRRRLDGPVDASELVAGLGVG